MPKRDPRVTEYIRQRAPFARPILRHLRKVIHEGAPGLEEAIKWGMPSFLYQGKMGNFGRIASIEDLPSPTALKAYIRKAVALISLA